MTARIALPTLALQQLAQAPHRLMFFVGAFNVLAAMAWWAAWLSAQAFAWPPLPQPPLPAGWAHALMLPLQVLAPFMFGFLLTVFPRWSGQQALGRWHYVPVGVGLMGGQVLFLLGLFGFPQLLHVGMLFSIGGWLAGMASLWPLLWRDAGKTPHMLACYAALALGLCAWLLFFSWWHRQIEPRWMFAAIKIAMFGFALPMYVSVCHRMLPFFASAVIPGYRMWRPLWWLLAFWALAFAHLLLELMHGYAWLWLGDLSLLALTVLALWRWAPRQPMPGLLAVLIVGFAWLPLAFALFAGQSLVFALSGTFVLGRAPLHALSIGFFASLLVAMVTRVTMGHSGRPLAMTPVAWFAFLAIQGVAVLRVLAELWPQAPGWQAVAAAGWLLAFLPWVLRSAGIYLRPRADGRPG